MKEKQIKDWEKFEKLKPEIKKYVHFFAYKKYKNIDEKLFKHLFHQAYDDAFIKFEQTYDPQESQENTWLSRLTKQAFRYYYKKHQRSIGESIKEDYDIPDDDTVDSDEFQNAMVERLVVIYGVTDKRSAQKAKEIENSILKRDYWSGSKKNDRELTIDLKTSYISTQLLRYKIGNVLYEEPESSFKIRSWIKNEERYWMKKTLKLSYDSFDVLKNIPIKDLDKDSKSDYPILSAIVLNNKGEFISSAYKGEFGNFEDHCEYLLFDHHKKLNNSFNSIKGGKLFVSLEPCIGRSEEKIPCAVRVAISPLKIVYVGIIDANESISQKGVEIIRTGIYTFNKNELKRDKGLQWLKEEYFNKEKKDTKEKVKVRLDTGQLKVVKKFHEIFEDDEYIKYAIGNSKEVKPFHRDIQVELLKLNGAFIKKQDPNKYRIYF